MKMLKKIISILLVVSMAISTFNFTVDVHAQSSAEALIKQLIVYYRDYQEDAATDIERVLDELKAVDQKTGEAWEKIMNYWAEINTDGYVNEVDILDDGADASQLPELDIDDSKVAIVVLGFALNDDGTMKEELIGRLQVGLALANKYPDAYVAVTGGGTAANNPDVTEGGLMGEWLLEQGLDADRLIVETRAPTTVGNAQYTYELLNTEYTDVESVIMVTSDYHVPRGSILFYSKFVLEALDKGGKQISIISNAGNETGYNGYETLTLQANGVCQVAGISTSGLPTVELSCLTGITVKQNTMYEAGKDLDLTVTATYNTGYTKDITDLVAISGFDKNADNSQVVTVSYEENGTLVTGELKLDVETKDIVNTSLLTDLIDEAKAVTASKYTKNSYARLQEVIAKTENELTKELTIEQLSKVHADLKFAMEMLRSRVNVAAYKKEVTTNATSIADGGIAAITDGKTSTYGTFGPDIKDLEIILELDAYYDLEEIVVRPYHSTKSSDYTVRSYFYDLYISEDGENWEFVTSHTATGTTDAGNSHPINSDLEVKYIKIDGTGKVNPGNQTNQSFHLAEVFAYGEETRDIVLGKPYTSSGADTSSASSSATATTIKAIDGNRSTYWDAGAYSAGPWLDIDLGDIYAVDSINVVTYVGSGRYYHFEVYASTDGVYYTKVAEKNDEVQPHILGTTFEFEEPVYASHLKVVGTYNSKNSAFHVAEFRAYGELATEEQLVDVARQEVQAIIDNVYRSDYTEASWGQYQDKRQEATDLIADENATIEQYQEMKAELIASKEKLEKGNPDEKEEGTFRLASFNIWAPNPTHPDVDAILAELLRCEVDYAGIQEVDRNNTRDNRDVIALIAGDEYEHSYQKAIDYKSGEYGIGQVSSTEMLEVTGGNYTIVAGEEGRAWQRMLVEIDGKQVAIYNTHLSLGQGDAFHSNVTEILEILENDPVPYKLLTGDFNATRDDMNAFKEKYNLSNGKDGLWYSTFEGDKYASGAGYIDGAPNADIESGIDNIVYTKNLELTNFRVVYNDNLSDHFMVYGDYKILAYEDDLRALVETCDYKESDYTSATYSAYADALATANELLANEDYTNLQDALKQATEELENAIEGLVEARFEIPTSEMSATTGNAHQGDPNEGPASFAIDGNRNTMWHTDWYPADNAGRDDHWLMITFDELKEINGMKVLQRTGQHPNGQVLKYDLYGRISEDSEWVLIVDDGTLTTSNDWQEVKFDATEVKEVKLQVLDATGDQPNKSFSALAEIRFTETGEDVEEVADYTAVNTAISSAEALNKDLYANFDAVEEAVAAVVRGLRVSDQATVDGYAEAINAAIAALVLKDADYSAVESALAAAEALNKADYVDVTELEAAIAAVVTGYKADKQAEVDAMAKAINDAILALVKVPADYSAVEEAIDSIPEDLTIYTDESLEALEAALDAVVEGLDFTRQDEVDAYAQAIADAVEALTVKAADYTKVEEAIALIPEVLDIYTEESLEALEAALEAVVEGLDITKQADVDAMAAAIEEAVEALELLPADYTEVEAALEAASKLNKDNYKDFSKVEEAVAAVVKGLDITKQEDVDAMANAIIEAILGLELKDAETEEPADPETPVEPEEQPEEEDKPEAKPEAKPEVPGTEEAPEADDNVNTSDNTPVFGLFALMVAAAFGFVVSRKRKED